MADLKNRMKSHVKAAKEWLGKAEQSFEQENEIRGDLNLMLAQAELKRAQETKSSAREKSPYRSLLTHSMLAVALVGMVLVFGFGGFGAREVIPVNAVAPASAVKAVPPVVRQDVGEKVQAEAKHVPVPDEVQPAGMVGSQPKIDAAVRRETAPAMQRQVKAAEVDISPAKMQQLMRAAGKSLRGQ